MSLDNFAARIKMLNLVKDLPQSEIDEMAHEMFFEEISAGDDFLAEIQGLKVAYGVLLFGSGLTGEIMNKSAYKYAREILLPIAQKGKLKCFKAWCERCRNRQTNLIDLPDFHIAKISFSNVKKIVLDQKIVWRWNNPNSEWAKAHGNPADFFQDLVDIKSNPNWKVTIGYCVRK